MMEILDRSNTETVPPSGVWVRQVEGGVLVTWYQKASYPMHEQLDGSPAHPSPLHECSERCVRGRNAEVRHAIVPELEKVSPAILFALAEQRR